ncbi:sensor histidine kinase [Halobaculum gomorrense]|uniref:histidine kinase n=1 Tax=Halobaculum gomorrense TaxID=43928 RepID=A0A1M5TUQ8_9EURY|nr:histidine kinase N-terminal 7TM domain-containing protein [Halobaculum gomorrense]SHH54326.1 PAS domain S-box-containing protein [Halobaculum gomorrense]
MSVAGVAVVVLALLAGVTAVVVGGYAWRNRAEPGATAFAAMMVGVAVWSLTYAVALTVFDPVVRLALEVPLEVGKAIVAPAWLFFALGYAGRGEYITRRLVAAVAVIPVATILLVATVPVHDLLWTNYRIAPTIGTATVTFDPGPWFYLHAGFGWTVIGAGMVFLLEPMLSYGERYRDQGLALIVGAAVSFAAHVKATFFLPPAPALDLTPLTLAVTGVLFGVALFRFDLLGLLPATQTLGRRAAIEDVGVGLVVVDTEGAIVEFNPAAESILGVGDDGDPGEGDESGVAGEDSVGGVAGEPLGAYVSGVELGAEGPQRIEVTDGAGYRAYEATTSPIGDHTGRTVGYTVSFADVTERELRRQRLEVLNRVLRHNLRNDMTVVVGNADLLTERVADEHRSLADAIARRGRALQRLGEKARDAEAVLADDAAPREIAVAKLCDDLVRRARESYPDGDVAASVPDGLTVTARAAVLETVLWNLVDNAFEHGDGAAVRIAVTDAADGVEFVVADDGPGVPAAELEGIRSGTETDLTHGSGLGLWVVRWGTRVLGADLAFDDREPSGTAVTVTLPRAEGRRSRPPTAGSGPE